MTKLNSIKFILIIMLFGITINTDKAFAKNSIYGRFDIALSSEDTLSGSFTDVKSHSSRLGFKGSQTFDNGVSAIYQYELQTDPIDGDPTFKQRNSFVGIKGSYGTLFLGTHDTALKKSQSKIDLFNDLAGDIKNILQGENRMSEFIGYTTPTLGDGFSATFNAIKGTEEEDNSIGDSTSVSLNYKTKSFYAAIAFDSELKGYDTTRISFQVPLNRTQLGFIYQDTKELSSGLEEDGYVLSLSQKIGKKGVFKIQLAESDMKMGSGKQTSIGYDYKLCEKAKAFIFYTDLSGESLSKEKEISALGFEYKF